MRTGQELNNRKQNRGIEPFGDIVLLLLKMQGIITHASSDATFYAGMSVVLGKETQMRKLFETDKHIRDIVDDAGIFEWFDSDNNKNHALNREGKEIKSYKRPELILSNEEQHERWYYEKGARIHNRRQTLMDPRFIRRY